MKGRGKMAGSNKSIKKKQVEVEQVVKEKVEGIQNGSLTIIIQDKQPIQINIFNKCLTR